MNNLGYSKFAAMNKDGFSAVELIVLLTVVAITSIGAMVYMNGAEDSPVPLTPTPTVEANPEQPITTPIANPTAVPTSVSEQPILTPTIPSTEPADESIPVSPNTKTYVHPTLGYSFEYDSNDWSVSNTDELEGVPAPNTPWKVQLLYKPAHVNSDKLNDYFASISIEVYNNPSLMNTDTAIENDFPNSSTIGAVMVDGENATYLQLPKTNEDNETRVVYVDKGEKRFIFTLSLADGNPNTSTILTQFLDVAKSFLFYAGSTSTVNSLTHYFAIYQGSASTISQDFADYDYFTHPNYTSSSAVNILIKRGALAKIEGFNNVKVGDTFFISGNTSNEGNIGGGAAGTTYINLDKNIEISPITNE